MTTLLLLLLLMMLLTRVYSNLSKGPQQRRMRVPTPRLESGLGSDLQQRMRQRSERVEFDNKTISPHKAFTVRNLCTKGVAVGYLPRYDQQKQIWYPRTPEKAPYYGKHTLETYY